MAKKNYQPPKNRRTLWNILAADVRQALLDIHQEERKEDKNGKESQQR